MSDKAVAVPSAVEFDREQVELWKRTFCKGASDDEARLFVAICKRTGLDPVMRQIFAIKRWDSRERREVMQAQPSIDGLRLIAERSGKYEGQAGPQWCGLDGIWHDVWVPDEEWPVAARVGVFKTGCREPFWSVAKYAEYMQTDRDGKPVSMWRKMPANQLAKCAEALSLRKAFPQEMSGMYTIEELPAAEPEPDEKPWRTFKGMIEEFSKLKAQLVEQMRESVYYEILEGFGVKHANGFRDSGKALAAYRDLEAAIENFPPPQETK